MSRLKRGGKDLSEPRSGTATQCKGSRTLLAGAASGEETLHVPQRKRIDLISATYRMAALAEVFGFEDSQSFIFYFVFNALRWVTCNQIVNNFW